MLQRGGGAEDRGLLGRETTPARRSADEALDAWPPYASPEAAAASLARTARIELQAAGHYEAKVDHEVRVTDAETEVVLRVVQGPKGQGVDVEFEGNQRLTGEELPRTLPKPGSREFFGALDRRARLVAGARVAYAGLGLPARARRARRAPVFDAASGRLVVTIPVREGASSRVAALTLPDGLPPPAEGGPELRLREGEPFDVEAYLADRDAIAAWYRREGWMEARVRGVLEVSGGDVRVTLAAEPGPRPRLGEVRIASSGRTHETDDPPRRPGPARGDHPPQELAETRARLSELGTFSSVDVRSVPVPGKAGRRRPGGELRRAARRRARVRPALQLVGELAAPRRATRRAARARDGCRRRRPCGLASPFGFGWRFGAYTLQTSARQNYRLGLEASTLFGLRVRTQLLAFDETDDEAVIAASFASKVRGFSVQQSRTLRCDTGSRRWHERLRLQWGYTNKDIRYSEEIGSDDIVGGQPRVPQRGPHRGRARLADRPAQGGVLDGHDRALPPVPRLGRRLRAALRPGVHVPAAAPGPRLGPGLPRRRRSRRRPLLPAREPLPGRRADDGARLPPERPRARSSPRTRASAARASSSSTRSSASRSGRA